MSDFQIIDGEKYAQEKLLDAAASCIHAIHKAPTISGRLKIKTMILTGNILEYMFEVQAIYGRVAAFNILSAMSWQKAYYAGKAPVLLLIGAETLNRSELGWNCGACGFKTCGELNKYAKNIDRSPHAQVMMPGPCCMWKVLDYGIVCDWACAQAWQLNITNRIEAASGMCARALGFLEDCDCVYGLPLGPMEDMFWYSRDIIGDMMPYDMWLEHAQTNYAVHWAVFPGHGRPTIKHGQEWWKTQKERILTDYDPEGIQDIAQDCLEEVAEVKGRAHQFMRDNGIELESYEIKL